LWKINLVLPLVKSTVNFADQTSFSLSKAKLDTTKQMTDWLEHNCKGNYRTLKNWRTREENIKSNISTNTTINTKKNKKPKTQIIYSCNYTIYINNENDYNKIISNFENLINETCSPANKFHEDLIKSGHLIEVQDDLYFSLYRYRVQFYMGGWISPSIVYKNISRKELEEFVKERFYDKNKDKKEQNYYLTKFTSYLYLKNKEDLISLKLSIPEHIKKITCVVLPEEYNNPDI
jgi:hypothetical protein